MCTVQITFSSSIIVVDKTILSEVRNEGLRKGVCVVNELMYKEQNLISMHAYLSCMYDKYIHKNYKNTYNSISIIELI